MKKRLSLVMLFAPAALGCFALGVTGCYAKDLQPIDGVFQVDTVHPTESETTPNTDSASAQSDTNATDSDTNTYDSSSSTETSTDSRIPVPTDSDSVTQTDSATDTEIGTDTVVDTGTDDSETATETAVPDETKWVGNITQNEEIPEGYFLLWNQITPENAGKWGTIEAKRDVMEWDALDAIYKEAVENGITFTAHPLVWHQQQPSWLSTLTPEEQKAEVEEWIAEFCRQYPDVETINVVSAPAHSVPAYAAALGGDGITGYDWVIAIYQMARDHCPAANLLVEEYNALIHETYKFAHVVALLNERELIDGIACTGNDLDGIPLDELEFNIDSLAFYQLPIYVSQFGVGGTSDDEQEGEMMRLFPALYEHPAIKGITLWGYVQGLTWKTDAWLIHSNGVPRPALTWLMQYLGRD
ncbi:MAG: endo-1,4-beta-xylanase [Deltaproteobacteria bacterium]|nr:endo-1,4-beta-xylanase [Deltaproteobacteria bacterium]